MKKIIRSSFYLCLVSALFSCAALTRYKCNREYAAKKGMEDADAGRVSQPGKFEGGSCEGDYSASAYTKDYLYGFEKKKSEVCYAGMASTLGKLDGDQGLEQKPQRNKFQLCSDSRDYTKILNSYDSEFQKAFCSVARVSKMGSEMGASLTEPDYESKFSVCGNKMKKIYTDAYKKGVQSFCTISQAERFGASEAANKKSIDDGLAKFSRCVDMGKADAKQAFIRSFEDTKNRILKDEADRAAQEAQRQALERERVRLARVDDFNRNVAATSFMFLGKVYYSRCSLGGMKSFVQVDVENPYTTQILIQGNWRIIYYNADFAKITEDRTVEAVLLTPNNRKSFQKLTLPRDAEYCRAEFTGNQ